MNEELSELSYQDFVLARKLHRQQEAKKAAKDAAPPESEKDALVDEDSSFVLYSDGPDGIYAVFEDFNESGWFYLYDAKQRKIVKAAHIYDRAKVAVDEDVVDIGWAVDGSACGLAVWGDFRAFLGVSNDLQLRKPVMDSEERGIPAGEWPAGFDRYLENKID
ncbi:MAG: DUF2251 domain-containing protein [Candidatus Acidiferrum sp.]